MTQIAQHPSSRLPEFRNFNRLLGSTVLAEFLWAGILFFYCMNPPDFLAPYSRPYFNDGIIYCTYSVLHAAYIFICLLLSRFLISRGWLRAAALGSMIPGFGIFFGLLQIVPAWIIFHELKKTEWVKFFQWRSRIKAINSLTSRRG